MGAEVGAWRERCCRHVAREACFRGLRSGTVKERDCRSVLGAKGVRHYHCGILHDKEGCRDANPQDLTATHEPGTVKATANLSPELYATG
jgi:hypothetical protein